MKKKMIGLTAALGGAVMLSACGGEEKEVTVGAKNFTEQFILAKMAEIMLEDNDFQVDMVDNMGSTALRQALESGEVELTWEYTGTGLITYNGEDPIADGEEAFEAISDIDADQGITWANMSDIDNAYTIMMREADGEEKGISSISDLAEYINDNPGEMTFATDAEFGNRGDGLPGVEETYGFEFGSDQVNEMSYGLNYEALANEEVSSAMGHATDSRIEEYDLFNLEDDQQFFPSYHAALSMRTEVYEEYPEIEEILQPLSEELDTETMMGLNYQVDIEDESVDEVARTYLEENGFLSE
ncbi:osmoprotectant transport system substrate-binding protein [Salsuginibacillus halophilus]|uniref:Osmoprotectant transport system substrate-binding protein n=1 Tax=Salsuginibacillus halophilus TaxID=517424 RepID=A0A2P8HL75_9BACI|nr:glycine betaine ABC transporter substrate-binding protein [Salsuginibacillus halophilus]PSL46956.1 osmoprotectant transport system substrate-binding protein [Salsuginibacillus halophilus]